MNQTLSQTTNQTVRRAANSSTSLTRVAAPVLGLAVFVTVGPVIGAAVHSIAVVLFEVGRVSSMAVQIFCS